MGRKRGRRSLRPPPATPVRPPSACQGREKVECFEGERLTELLQKIGREVELERLSKGGLPDKIWMKQQFAIGLNDVIRVLERMAALEKGLQAEKTSAMYNHLKGPSVSLQAVLVASDCTPRYLALQIQSLAKSRGVSLIFVRDKRGGSLRLGELVNIKNAIAIGVKDRGSRINKAIGEIIQDIGLEAVSSLQT